MANKIRNPQPGDRHFMLTVVEELPFRWCNRKNRPPDKVRWLLCKCDCGQTKEIRMCHFGTDRIRSCGCIGKKQVFLAPGTKMHDLTFVKELEPRFAEQTIQDRTIKYRRFLCSCICGGETVVDMQHFVAGNVMSCGCATQQSGRFKTPKEFIESHVTKQPNGCWTWNYFTCSRGYGQLTYRGVKYLAHRFSWEAYNGSIPEGMFVCHKCDNPSCCAPTCLFLGTTQDNTADSVAKKRHAFGERNGNAILKEEDVLELRQLYAAGKSLKEIALLYADRVAYETVQSALSGATWKHLL